ncbi:MAG: hypothetical protein H0W72_03440 [Planctomycetes bacterium]|nr:hypothetical protein [Planctomycetota bacterium]
MVDTPLGPVQFLGVHLRPAMGATGFTVSAYLSTDTVRANEIAVHAAELAGDQPAIVLGDFNEDGEPIAWLERRGFTNALPEYDRSTPTWRWQTRLVELYGRYDHLCYSRHLDCCAARVIDAGASDHFPVVGVFTLKQTIPATAPAR